jgi:hypothetical protein
MAKEHLSVVVCGHVDAGEFILSLLSLWIDPEDVALWWI